MILCSCNSLSSNTVKQIIDDHSFDAVPSVQEIMGKHGCSVVCATCAHTIKIEIRRHYENTNRTIHSLDRTFSDC
jgi:bacterioferritin-associated ferredoxin